MTEPAQSADDVRRVTTSDVARKRQLLALVDSIIRLPVTYDEALEATYLAVMQLREPS